MVGMCSSSYHRTTLWRPPHSQGLSGDNAKTHRGEEEERRKELANRTKRPLFFTTILQGFSLKPKHEILLVLLGGWSHRHTLLALAFCFLSQAAKSKSDWHYCHIPDQYVRFLNKRFQYLKLIPSQVPKKRHYENKNGFIRDRRIRHPTQYKNDLRQFVTVYCGDFMEVMLVGSQRINLVYPCRNNTYQQYF